MGPQAVRSRADTDGSQLLHRRLVAQARVRTAVPVVGPAQGLAIERERFVLRHPGAGQAFDLLGIESARTTRTRTWRNGIASLSIA